MSSSGQFSGQTPVPWEVEEGSQVVPEALGELQDGLRAQLLLI